MVITQDGKIGIGTTSPTARLDVTDQIALTSGGNKFVKLSIPGGNGGAFELNDDTGTKKVHISARDSDLTFFNAGNVGIGTTNPGNYKLAVNGTIHAKKVEVDLDNWSDYVLKDDYNLKSLDEVEEFIKKNGHLPDIPSESEVKTNGIDLGGMNAKLLQKIEELTLYMIDMKKENDELRKDVVELRKEIK